MSGSAGAVSRENPEFAKQVVVQLRQVVGVTGFTPFSFNADGVGWVVVLPTVSGAATANVAAAIAQVIEMDDTTTTILERELTPTETQGAIGTRHSKNLPYLHVTCLASFSGEEEAAKVACAIRMSAMLRAFGYTTSMTIANTAGGADAADTSQQPASKRQRVGHVDDEGMVERKGFDEDDEDDGDDEDDEDEDGKNLIRPRAPISSDDEDDEDEDKDKDKGDEDEEDDRKRQRTAHGGGSSSQFSRVLRRVHMEELDDDEQVLLA